MTERALTSLVDTLLAAVDGKADIDQRILLAQALQVIDRRLTAIEGRGGETPPDGPPCPARWQLGGRLADQRCMLRGPHTQHQTAEVDGLTGEWSDPDRGEIVPRDEPSPREVRTWYPNVRDCGAVGRCRAKPVACVLHGGPEMHDAWSRGALRAVDILRALEVGPVIRHVCGPDGQCTYHRTGGVPVYRCSGVAK